MCRLVHFVIHTPLIESESDIHQIIIFAIHTKG